MTDARAFATRIIMDELANHHKAPRRHIFATEELAEDVFREIRSIMGENWPEAFRLDGKDVTND